MDTEKKYTRLREADIHPSDLIDKQLFMRQVAVGPDTLELWHRSGMMCVLDDCVSLAHHWSLTELPVKHDEKPANIKSLDKFLTVKGVTALRDNLSSYDKILQSVAEKLHIAGLVPVSKLEPLAQNYHVLWRVTNRHSYVMTSHAGMSDDILKKLTGGLKRLLMDTSDVSNARQVQVLSAVERGEAGQ